MKTVNLFTNAPETFPHGKADFLLAVRGSFVGDAEFLNHEKVFSKNPREGTSSGVSFAAVATRAVHTLASFSALEILDFGLETKPHHCTCHDFGITQGLENGDAKTIFLQGMHFAKHYELRGNYLILGQSTPFQTANIEATLLALSSNTTQNNFEKLSLLCDPMLIFYAGFLMEATRRFHVVLAGGLQMAACLLIADKVKEDVFMRIKHDNVTLATCSKHEANADISHVLAQLSFTPLAVFTSFSFESAFVQKKQEEEANETALCAALYYANANDIEEEKLLQTIEYLLYTLEF